jgi:hypothetical protein
MEKKLPPAYWDGRNDKAAQSLYLIGRLKDGVSKEQANAVVNLIFKQSLHERAGRNRQLMFCKRSKAPGLS